MVGTSYIVYERLPRLTTSYQLTIGITVNEISAIFTNPHNKTQTYHLVVHPVIPPRIALLAARGIWYLQKQHLGARWDGEDSNTQRYLNRMNLGAKHEYAFEVMNSSIRGMHPGRWLTRYIQATD
jgi:hypothetical protein